jgi:hypothetical protein
MDPALDYEDPEENNWVLPDISNPTSVPDNTSCYGPLYFWRGIANPAQARVSIAVTREITPPWRRGLGISVCSKKRAGRAIGLWFRGRPPRILSEAPVEQDWQEVVRRANELKGETISE